MKRLIFLFLLLNTAYAQDSLNVRLLFNWQEDTLVPEPVYGIIYNEIWGVQQDGRDYAIIGTNWGTHIFDVTDPVNSVMVDQIPGAQNRVVHRDYHDYQGYLYMVSDEGASTLQIADMSYLPDSVHVVYDSDTLFPRAHNIFIDSSMGNMYTTNGDVYSLADPTDPVLIGSHAGSHDIFVRNDTGYFNQGFPGMRIYDFGAGYSSPSTLSFLNSYPDQGYNHSGWLNTKGDVYAFADETYGMDIKICDVSDPSSPTVLSQVNSGGDTAAMVHNLIIKDDYLYVAYYHDGLYVYNISDPANPVTVGHYDTYHLTGPPIYNGAWGVYPFLSGNKVLVSDTEFGLFVLDVADVFVAGINELVDHLNIEMVPNPTNGLANISVPKHLTIKSVEVLNPLGQLIDRLQVNGMQSTTLDLGGFSPGWYMVRVSGDDFSKTERVVIAR